jgi:hypothetical protein
MPNFKPKTNKNIKVDKKTIETLDNKHNEMLNTFHYEETKEIPNLLNEKKNLLNKLENKNILIEEKLDIEDSLKKIDKSIKEIKKNKKQYLLDNASHIFGYFEEKKNISNGFTKSVILDSFFKKEKDKDTITSDNKNKNVKQFFSNIDNNFFDINDYIQENSVCRYCNKGELIPVDEDGLLVCNNCSKTIIIWLKMKNHHIKNHPKKYVFMRIKE